MKVIDYIRHSTSPIFSFEILPPLKGNSIQKVYDIIDRLTEFDPKFINITSHHSESVFMPQPDGLHRKVSLRRRPGTVAVAAAIKYKYGIIPVPHIICTGFSKEETEYALLDLNFLGIDNLFIVRGDSKNIEPQWNDKTLYNRHATDLQQQINEFNCGCGLNGMHIDGIETKFSYGMACLSERKSALRGRLSDYSDVLRQRALLFFCRALPTRRHNGADHSRYQTDNKNLTTDTVAKSFSRRYTRSARM